MLIDCMWAGKRNGLISIDYLSNKVLNHNLDVQGFTIADSTQHSFVSINFDEGRLFFKSEGA